MKILGDNDIDYSYFHCCGDEDLYPFKCPNCQHKMVYCYECDTLYSDLSDMNNKDTPVNSFNPDIPIFSCPNCNYEFEYYFMKNPIYRVELQEWIDAGYEHLLPDELKP